MDSVIDSTLEAPTIDQLCGSRPLAADPGDDDLDDIDEEDTVLHEELQNEFDATKEICSILEFQSDDARARILAHAVAYFGLGEIYQTTVLRQE